MAAHLAPERGDVVVRQKRGNPSTLCLLRTPSAPDQFTLRTRDEAVSQALAFAKRQQVQAWFANGGEFVLLGTFRKEHAAPEGQRDGEISEEKNSRCAHPTAHRRC